MATLIFSASENRVLLIFVPLPPACSRHPLLDQLKEQLPDLRYTPSRHDPQLQETDNRKPFYSLRADDTVRLLVEPGVGMWLAYDRCFD
jgi:hypothetical protein